MSEESRTLDEILAGIEGARLLSRGETMKARACLALDCLTRLSTAIELEMTALRNSVYDLYRGGIDGAEQEDVVEACERSMKECVHNAVCAARAVSSPMMHEIPGALPGDGKEVDA